MDITEPINILLVEDSPSDATFILHALEQSALAGNVRHVLNGEDALAALQAPNESPRPDMMLLDLKLPGLDGFDVLQEVKNHDDWKSILVIIVTSSALEEDIHQAMRLQADHYLSKPLDLEGYTELVSEIEEFWRSRNGD